MKVRVIASLLVTAALSIAASTALAADRLEGDTGTGINDRACGTIDPTPQEAAALLQSIETYRKSHPFESMAVGGQIKVAFHVIYSGSTGNIPQSQIDSQIAYLNRAYSGALGGANTAYTFVLASVSRTNNSSWFGMTPGSTAERNAKQALATDITHRLNVYSCRPGQNLLGWAYFPNSYPEGDWHHGVVIHYGSVPGGYLSPYNLGGTLAHEAGHYLGLYHTFQGGCSAPGDYVSDTPYEATPTSGCPSGKNTCSSAGVDPIHNFMDYSTDACYTQFTSGQDSRMDGIVPVYRPHLLNAALVAGGADVQGSPNDPMASRSATDAAAPSLAFRGAFPNPFSLATTMRFAIPKDGNVSLKLYTVTGQLVRTLVEGELTAGEQFVTLRKGELPPGMYFASLRYGGATVTRSVILLP
jgi:hypothetical protein